jgi:hypothetical protein
MLARPFVLAGAAAALAAACSLQDPTAFTAAGAISLTASADTAAADGISRTTIVAELLGDTPTGTELVFETDAGTFAGAQAATPRQVKLKTVGRTAEVVHIAGVDPGVATLTLVAGGFTVQDAIVLYPAAAASIELGSDLLRAPANGVNGITLTARARRPPGQGTVSRGTRVRFAFTLNGLPAPNLESTVETDEHGVASRSLVTRTPGAYRVISSAGLVADTVVLEFTPEES